MATGRTSKRLPGKASALTANYLALIRRFPLRPIRSEGELDRAIAVVNGLLDRERLTAPEEDYLDVLSDLVERYEDKHHAIGDNVSEAAMLRFMIDQKGVRQTEVARATGIAESTISAVLSDKRKLTRSHLNKLASYFHVSPTLFMPETATKRKRRHAAPSR